MEIETLLYNEIVSELEELNKLDVGSDEYKVAAEGIAKLIDRSIEMDKIKNERDERQTNRENDIELKTRQVNEEIKDRKIKNVITIVVSGVGTIVTIWGTLKTLKFEETGTVTTMAGKNFINKIFRK